MTLSPNDLETACRSFVSARPAEAGAEVTVPVLYPNGQAVTVLVTAVSGGFAVHDAGAGAMFLTLAGIDLSRKLQDKLQQAARTYGCDFMAGRMTTTCTAEQVAVSVVLVANASRAVADHALRTVSENADLFREAVSAHLRTIVGPRLREKEEITGNSGRSYRVGNVILDRDLHHPVAFVEAVPGHGAVERRVSEFLDLREEYPDITREAVYDDRIAWENHSLILLRHVSNPTPFSNSPARFRAIAG